MKLDTPFGRFAAEQGNEVTTRDWGRDVGTHWHLLPDSEEVRGFRVRAERLRAILGITQKATMVASNHVNWQDGRPNEGPEAGDNGNNVMGEALEGGEGKDKEEWCDEQEVLGREEED